MGRPGDARRGVEHVEDPGVVVAVGLRGGCRPIEVVGSSTGSSTGTGSGSGSGRDTGSGSDSDAPLTSTGTATAATATAATAAALLVVVGVRGRGRCDPRQREIVWTEGEQAVATVETVLAVGGGQGRHCVGSGDRQSVLVQAIEHRPTVSMSVSVTVTVAVTVSVSVDMSASTHLVG